jgi:hypothetical protein
LLRHELYLKERGQRIPFISLCDEYALLGCAFEDERLLSRR